MTEIYQHEVVITVKCFDCETTQDIHFHFEGGDCEYVEDSDREIYLYEFDVYKGICPNCGEEQRHEMKH